MDDDGVKMNGHTLEVSFFKTFQRQICVFSAAFESTFVTDAHIRFDRAAAAAPADLPPLQE
jgi:hypothetical protein